jgi:hypothetical protein
VVLYFCVFVGGLITLSGASRGAGWRTVCGLSFSKDWRYLRILAVPTAILTHRFRPLENNNKPLAEMNGQ